MFFLYFIGIDISKYKHDCFITTETGEVIVENFSFQNTNEGLNQLLDLLKSLDCSVDYKPLPKQFYHKFALKSLSRKRDKLVFQRSYYLVQITNILDLIFPEFKPLFDNQFSVTSLYILNKYKTVDKIKNMKDYESINKVSRGKFSYSKFLKIKEAAKNTIRVF